MTNKHKSVGLELFTRTWCEFRKGAVHGNDSRGAAAKQLLDCGLPDHNGTENIEHRKRLLDLQFQHIIASWLTKTIV